MYKIVAVYMVHVMFVYNSRENKSVLIPEERERDRKRLREREMYVISVIIATV